MREYNKLVFYYAVFIITVLLIGSVFFFPKPFNIIQPLLLAPIFLFFWLKITDPEHATESSWSMRLLIVIVSLSGLGVLGYYLASTIPQEEVQVSQDDNNSASVSAEIAKLRAELESMQTKPADDKVASDSAKSERSSELLDLLNSLDTTNVLNSSDEAKSNTDSRIVRGYVKVSGNEAIDVYEKNNSDSRIVGVALTDNKMPFYQSAGSWYEVEYDKGLFGFVKASQVIEVN